MTDRQVAEAPPELDARTLLGYLWEATGKRPNLRVRDLFTDDDPLVKDVERILAAAALVPDSLDVEQCPDRCGGRVGHSGPHQSSDYDPDRGALDVERLRTALETALSVVLHEEIDPDCSGEPPYSTTHARAVLLTEMVLRAPVVRAARREGREP